MTRGRAPADEPAVKDAEHDDSATHLDTYFLINALVPGSPEDRRLRKWILDGTTIAMSSVAWAEFLCGPISDEDRRRARDGSPYFLESHSDILSVFERRRLAALPIAAARGRVWDRVATNHYSPLMASTGSSEAARCAGT